MVVLGGGRFLMSEAPLYWPSLFSHPEGPLAPWDTYTESQAPGWGWLGEREHRGSVGVLHTVNYSPLFKSQFAQTKLAFRPFSAAILATYHADFGGLETSFVHRADGRGDRGCLPLGQMVEQHSRV